jgi:hypothetical protein
MSNINLHVVQSNITGSYWVKGEGFVAESKDQASKLTFTEANKIEMQFWKSGVKKELVSA